METDAVDRSPSVPLSRGLKIEDLANVSADSQSDASKLFSREALSHAVSGSIGGNIAMLGANFSCSFSFAWPPFLAASKTASRMYHG